jgi:hypothetical protein
MSSFHRPRLMLHRIFDVRRRHPLLRLLLGAAALVAIVAFGLFVAVALLIGGALVLLANALRAPHRGTASKPAPTPSPPGVIEGEFTIIHGEREHGH